MPDASTEAGRRVAEHLFPGRDRAAYDDMGLHPRQIAIEGVIMGDDYVATARAMEGAFETPGPGQLIHPWLGPLLVILVEPATITFTTGELRVARFSATFTVYSAMAGVARSLRRSTASTIRSAAHKLIRLAVNVFRGDGDIRTYAQLAAAAATHKALQIAIATSPMALARSGLLLERTPDTPIEVGQQIADIVGSWAEQIEEASRSAAVAPAAEAEDQNVTAEPLAIVADGEAVLLFEEALTIVARLTDDASDAPSRHDVAYLLAASAVVLASAAEVSLSITYIDRTGAQRTRERFAGEAAKLSSLGEARLDRGDAHVQVTLSDLVEAVPYLVQAISADINEVIGRLPPVLIVSLAQDTDTFAIANHLHGDTPELVEECYRSLVRRNDPRHPSAMPQGPVEALL